MTKESRTAQDLAEILRGSRIPALDGIRAVAVFLVIGSHGGMTAGGSLGVNAFFVLSGFLITHLLLKEKDKTGSIRLRDFYLRRALRIFPAYYAFLAFSMLVDTYQGDPRSSNDILAASLYFQNYWNAWHGHSNSSIAHSWSLAVEEQFYLFWPLLLLVTLRRSLQRSAAILAIVIVAVFAWRSVGYLELGMSRSWAYNAFDARFDSLAIGCLLAILMRFPWPRRQLAAAASRSYFALLTLSLIALPFFLAGSSWKYSVGFTYEALLVGLLLVQLIPYAGRGMWAWLEFGWVRYLGAISYPLYLYHQWGLGLGDNFVALPKSTQLALGIGFSVILASGSYWLVEKPFLRLKSRFTHS